MWKDISTHDGGVGWNPSAPSFATYGLVSPLTGGGVDWNLIKGRNVYVEGQSPPARGEWIEIIRYIFWDNSFLGSLPQRGGVDWNSNSSISVSLVGMVFLRTEEEDRNMDLYIADRSSLLSHEGSGLKYQCQLEGGKIRQVSLHAGEVDWNLKGYRTRFWASPSTRGSGL